jgi:DHA1 family bicyclomycin/chloramphenicol resistance-like MFS transporter
MIGAFGMASFFAYLANSSFIMISYFHLSPSEYGLSFSVNAASFIGMAQLNGGLSRRFGLRRVVRVAVIGYAVTMTGLLLITLAGCDRLDVLIGLLMLGYGFLGLVGPAIGVLALDAHGPIAGTASALMGTIQFVVGAGAMALVGIFANGTPLPMVAGIAACAWMTLLFALATLKEPDGRLSPV